MPADTDILIVGLGAMDSAATCQLARRGLRVIGFDLAERLLPLEKRP
jgi:NADPH-dependent 2,4-dienoyl-CoA reductase/sulfur reductase-like enzyme